MSAGSQVIRHVVVVGSGLMGSGIAQVDLNKILECKVQVNDNYLIRLRRKLGTSLL